jgi:predicted MFS family arabinose efflux permease
MLIPAQKPEKPNVLLTRGSYHIRFCPKFRLCIRPTFALWHVPFARCTGFFFSFRYRANSRRKIAMRKRFSAIWHEAVGGLPSDFWILWSGILVNRIGAMALAFLSFFVASKGFSENIAALAVSCWGIGGLTATFFGGWTADRIGRKPTLLAGLLLSALAMLAMPWANAALLIDLFAFLAGFAFDFQRPAVFATVADLVPVSDRVRAFGLNYWAVNIGASLAPLIGGVLATFSFLFLFLFDAASSLCYFALILFRLREPAKHRVTTGTRPSPFAAFADRRMLLLFILSTFLTAQFFQAYSTLPLVMRLHGMNAADYSRAILLNGLTVVILSIPLSRVLQRISAARALALAAVCVGVGFFLTQFARTVPEYAGTVFVWTLGEIGIASTTPALISRLSPPTQRGVYQGTYAMCWSLGILVGPAVGGWTLQVAGSGVLWSACGVVGCCVAALFWVFFERIPLIPAEQRKELEASN